MSEILDEPEENFRKLNFLSNSMNEYLQEILLLLSNQLATKKEANAQATIQNGIHLRLTDDNLWINQIMIPLNSRPRTLGLLQAFFKAENFILDKNGILEAVYGPFKQRSERFAESQDNSLTKLLGRTRHYLETCLSSHYQFRNMEWLVYDGKNKKYHLFMMRRWNSPFDIPTVNVRR